MTIGRKMYIGYGLILALLLVITAVGMSSLTRLPVFYDENIEVNERLADEADAIGLRVRDQVVHFRGAVLYPQYRDEYLNLLQQARDDFNAIVTGLGERVEAAEDRLLLESLVEGQDDLAETQDRILDLVAAEERVTADVGAGDVEAAQLSNRLLEQAAEFRDRRVRQVAEGRARVARGVPFVTNLMLYTAIVAIVAGFVVAGLVSRSITKQLQDGILRLSSSAAQILSTTAEVAAGTAQTATAVSETTATVEEVKQTAQAASQKAKQVSDSAQRMTEVAQNGRDSVEDTVEVMNSIQVQMESVAGSIVQLAEQSQAIGEIIATVNDLAEQSNLLAVNAAIEATRAGEHGKGFGVVAQEVRSLASQSKQATSQVRTLLGDIQKATNAAVLATEQGKKAVGNGSSQTQATSEAINQLADSVIAAAQAATQIAASNQQQMVGMDQVALAMDNIKQASSQNVAGTRQAEEAAQDLQELGRSLKRLISKEAA
ncbi:MAG: methyl-accepting chemotaxis protein [Trueperaceae bacterium]